MKLNSGNFIHSLFVIETISTEQDDKQVVNTWASSNGLFFKYLQMLMIQCFTLNFDVFQINHGKIQDKDFFGASTNCF
jgi:hypothetical protein